MLFLLPAAEVCIRKKFTVLPCNKQLLPLISCFSFSSVFFPVYLFTYCVLCAPCAQRTAAGGDSPPPPCGFWNLLVSLALPCFVFGDVHQVFFHSCKHCITITSSPVYISLHPRNVSLINRCCWVEVLQQSVN